MAEMAAYALDYVEPPKHEIIDGKTFLMSPSATPNHNRAVLNISGIFMNYLSGKSCEVFNDVDVHLEKDIVIPDVLIVCDKEKIKSDGIHGAPDVVVEVLSPATSKRDKGYKFRLYERSGVKEYWLVNTHSLSVDIYVQNDGKFVLFDSYDIIPQFAINKMTQEECESIVYSFTSPTFPDLEISLEDLFLNIT